MKQFIFGFLFALVLLFIAVGSYRLGLKKAVPVQLVQPTQPVQSTISPTQAAVSESKEDIVPLIAHALIAKNHWDAAINLEVTINKNDGTYASGTVREKGVEAGGGYFYAVKDGETWKIVADGNGVITCSSLVPYPSYPLSMIPECWDDVTGALKQR